MLDQEAPDPELFEPDLRDQVRLAEALLFASATPVPMRALTQLLPPEADPEAVLAALS